VGGVGPELAVADQLPRAVFGLGRCALETPPAGAPAARGRIELVLDADRRAAPPHALFRRQRPHALVAVARVHDEGAAGLERAPEAVEHQPVFVLGEIADGAEQVHGQVELTGELHVADVLAGERERDTAVGGGLAGPAQLGLAEVDAGRRAAPARELDRVAAEPARGVEHAGAGVERGDAGDPLHVARGVGRLDRLRDLRPRFAEEAFALEHEGHYSPFMTTLVTGAFGCIGAWVIRGLLAALRASGRVRPRRRPVAATSLDAGIRQTLDEFARLQKDGRLDSRELT